LLNLIIQQAKLYFKNTAKNSYNRPQPTLALSNVNLPAQKTERALKTILTAIPAVFYLKD